MAPRKGEFPGFPMTKALRKWYAKIGKKGGLIGGKRTADGMTPEQRQERARKAALARWKKKRKA
jgi:hypothetical protein